MWTVGLLARLRRHKLWLAAGVVVATLASAAQFGVGLFPPSFKVKSIAHSTASTEVVVGTSFSLRLLYHDGYVKSLQPRAQTLADMVASPEVLGYIARAARMPASKIGVDTPLWSNLERIEQWATGDKRAAQILNERDPYRITLDNDPSAPIIYVATQAPTGAEAARLAAGVPRGLSNYVDATQNEANIPPADRYRVSQLAPVSIQPGSKSGPANVAVVTFVSVLLLWCGAILFASGLTRDLRETGANLKVRGILGRSSGNEAHRSGPSGASNPTG